jgi:IS6 family transposase
LHGTRKKSYLQQISQFARYFHKSPELLGPEDIRSYQIYLTNEKKLAPGSLLIAVAALRFLYGVSLQKNWSFEEVIPTAKKPQRLPVVLSPEEVLQFLRSVGSTKQRAILTTCYAAGLRVSEAVHLKPADIDSQRGSVARTGEFVELGFKLKSMSRFSTSPFKWRQHKSQLILLCVSWYLEFTLSYRPLARLVKQQGWTVNPSSIFRWVQRYGPEWAARCRPFLKPTNRSYRVDETYIKVKGEIRYLYRAVDSTGQTIDFLLTAKRDKSSAKRFFQRAWRDSANVLPRVINVDKNAAYPPAFQELQAEGVLSRRCRLRRCKFLNNVIEQDHRTLKRRVKLAMGYGSFRTAWRTIQGIEAMHMIRKGRIRRVAKGDIVAQVRFLHRLFGVAVERNPV